MNKYKVLLFLVIFIGFVLRFYRLSSIPISLNIDETALGYNAYSILKTGADEYGKFLPLSLQSFGDWKLPGYPVLDIIPILIFGLTEFAVRFPSALAGLIAIPLIYVLANQLFNNKKIALFASFFLAVSPWGIFFSRIAYEANIATTLLMAGIICFIKYFYEKKNGLWFVVASFLWGLTIFTYHAFVVFMPLFFFGIVFLLIKDGKIRKKEVLVSVVIFLIFIIVSVGSTLSGSINKLSTTSLFDDKNMLNQRVNIYRGDSANENIIFKKILHNNYSAVAYQIGQNYLSTFSPSFLFDVGGSKLMSNTGDFGNFYLFDALLLVVGAGAMLWKKESKLGLLFIWFIFGPIPSSITSDAPSSTRLYLMVPAFTLVISYGAYSILNYLSGKNILYLLGKIILIFLFLLNFIYFLDAYYIHMNYHRAQYFHYGYKEVVELANKYPTYKVVMYDSTNFPYISFLFYNKYDPLKFRKEVIYYPANFGPFHYVKSFDRFSFVDNIDYGNMQANTLYIDYRGIRMEDFKILDPSGQPVFKYFFKNK